MNQMTHYEPKLPAVLEQMRAYGQVMLNTLDQMLDSDPRSPYALRFRDWAIYGGRYIGFWVDESRLYHLSLDQLAHKRVTDRLSLSVHKPVFAVHDPAIGFLYVVQLVKPPKPTVVPQADLPRSIEMTTPTQDRLQIGVAQSGIVAGTRREWKNIMVTGAQGWGKSALLRVLFYQASVNGWQIYIAEPPDSTTFHPIEYWKRAAGVAVIGEDARALRTIVSSIGNEIAQRSKLFDAFAERNGGLPPRDIEDYTERAGQALPPIMLLVDELPELLSGDRRGTLLDDLCDLIRIGRKWGVLVVAGSQSWQVNTINKKLSALFETRICYRVSDRFVANTALNITGGEWADRASTINVEGRAIVRSALSGLQLMQTYQVSDDRLKALLASSPAATSAPASTVTLTEQQRDMVRYALGELGGFFNLKDLSREFYGTLTPRQELRDLARDWERKGWLHKPARVNESRPIGRELRDAVGWVPAADQRHTTHATHVESPEK